MDPDVEKGGRNTEIEVITKSKKLRQVFFFFFLLSFLVWIMQFKSMMDNGEDGS